MRSLIDEIKIIAAFITKVIRRRKLRNIVDVNEKWQNPVSSDAFVEPY